jgi:hypothetical protein
MTDDRKNSDDPRAEVMETHHKIGVVLIQTAAKLLDELSKQGDRTNTVEKLDLARKLSETGARMQLEAYEHWDEYQRGNGAVTVEDQMDVAAALAESRHSGAIPEGATLAEAVEAVLHAYDCEVDELTNITSASSAPR